MLKEGDKAPAFDLESDEGGNVSLTDFANNTLVLYFYPRDNTPGCTRQAQGFTAAKRTFEAAGATVIGVSRDSGKSHLSFREKCGLGITLLSDPDLSVHKAYGAWGTKTMYGKKIEGVLRTTFVIDRGKVTRVFANVKVDGHADAVLHSLSINRNEDTMAAKKSKKSSKKSAAASLGEAAGELVAKAVGKVAAAIAPAKKKVKAKAKKAVAGAKGAVKKTAAKVVKKTAGKAKKTTAKVVKKTAGKAKKKAAGGAKKKAAAKRK